MVTQEQITLKKTINPDETPIFNSLCGKYDFDYNQLNRGVTDETSMIRVVNQQTWENKDFYKTEVDLDKNNTLNKEESEKDKVSKYLDIHDFYENEVLNGGKQQDFNMLMTTSMISRYVHSGMTEGVTAPIEIYSWLFSGFYGLNTVEEFGEEAEEDWKNNLYVLGEFLSGEVGDFDSVEVPITTMSYEDLKDELESKQGIDGLGPFQVLRINKIQVPKKNFSGLIKKNDNGDVVVEIRTGENKGKSFPLQELDTVDIMNEDSNETCNIYKQLYELI